MAWHQGLQDPIPQFQQHLQMAATTPMGPRERGRGPSNPVTWGGLKTLSMQATELMKKKGHEQTPENFLASIIACLNYNSGLTVLCVFCLCFPMLIADPLQDRLQYNLWVKLAQDVNVSEFCLNQVPDIHGLLSTCLIPVCKAPGKLGNITGLNNYMNESIIKYGMITSGAGGSSTFSRKRFPSSIELYTPVVANHENNTCARVVNCTQSCRKVGQPKWNCSHPQNVSYNWLHMSLPIGWFFTCGQRTFNYVPANLSDTICCLSRLVPVLPDKSQVRMKSRDSRQRRDAEIVDSSCNANVILLSPAEYISLGVSLVGVPGLAVHNSKTLAHLACLLAKSINATSSTLGLLAQEQSELRQAILDNRAAIDYLLLQQHLGCEVVANMCCFNLTDNSWLISKQLKKLEQLAGSVKQDILPQWWNDVWSWLPLGWVRVLIQYILFGLAILIFLACLIQCGSGMLGWCFSPCRTQAVSAQNAFPVSYTPLVTRVYTNNNDNYTDLSTDPEDGESP